MKRFRILIDIKSDTLEMKLSGDTVNPAEIVGSLMMAVHGILAEGTKNIVRITEEEGGNGKKV